MTTTRTFISWKVSAARTPDVDLLRSCVPDLRVGGKSLDRTQADVRCQIRADDYDSGYVFMVMESSVNTTIPLPDGVTIIPSKQHPAHEY